MIKQPTPAMKLRQGHMSRPTFPIYRLPYVCAMRASAAAGTHIVSMGERWGGEVRVTDRYLDRSTMISR